MPNKRQRLCGPSLEDSLVAIRSQKDLVLGSRGYSYREIATSLVDKLSAVKAPTPDRPPLFSDSDISTVSNMLLLDTFGDLGRNRVLDFVQQCFSSQDAAEATRAALQVETLCEELKGYGQEALALFAAEWAEDVNYAAPQRSSAPIFRVRRLHHRITLCQRWERFQERSKETDQLSIFLAGQGYPAKKHVRLQSRLAKYFAEKLRLTNTKSFSDRLYLSKPFVILTDAFGPGVLVFLSNRLPTSFRKLESDHMPKEDKFKIAVQFLAGSIPEIRQVCDIIHENLLGPLLRGEEIRDTTGTRLARGGRWDKLNQLSLREIVSADTL